MLGRSIWNSKKLLKEGLIWRVGDETKIRIWEDPWLPVSRAHPVRSPGSRLDNQAKVSELLDASTNWWNTAVVQENFDEEDAKLICSICVNPRKGADMLAWKSTRNRVFTVRSAYHLVVEKVEEGEASCSDNQVSHNLWKKIWNFKGSRVVKFFLWKACNDILPTKEKLHRRKVVSEPFMSNMSGSTGNAKPRFMELSIGPRCLGGV
jgi:hypothetical protein